MIEKIDPFPPIPETLRTAALQRKIVPFVGAGVSKLGGCPNWDEFANAVLLQTVKRGYVTHAQLDQVRYLPSRVKLSIALEAARQHKGEIDFNAVLKSRDDDKRKYGDKVYKNLSQLATTFVTTNYDDWLDYLPPAPVIPEGSTDPRHMRPAGRQVFCKRDDLSCANLDVADAVFHIHGSMQEPESMILTTMHYLERYATHRMDGNKTVENPYLTFLEMLFRLKSVLFIGYGLSELEILEFVVQKGSARQKQSDEEPKHYVVQGYFSHELELARNMERYFTQFGIGLLPFSRDGEDWDQLAAVIEYLAREIPPGDVIRLPKRKEMEELWS